MNGDCVAPVCEDGGSRDSAVRLSVRTSQKMRFIYPLTAIAERETPSGAIVTSSSVSQYSLVIPVSGASIVIR